MSEGYATRLQLVGTRFFIRSVCIASSMADIFILPKIASWSWVSEVVISASRVL